MPNRLYTPPRSLRFALLATMLASFLAPVQAGAVVLESHHACQKAIAKGGRLYFSSALKTLARCDRERMAAPGTDPCSDSRVSEALVKAENKLSESITKGCAGLSDEELSDPRPGGLALVESSALVALIRGGARQVADDLVLELHGTPGTTAASDEAMDCQAALDKAALKQASGTFKLLGSSCHDREDKGKSVTGEVTQILEACRELMALSSDALADKVSSKTVPKCTTSAIAELASCPETAVDRTPETVTACLLDAASEAAAAVIATTHGRENPRLMGRVESVIGGVAGSVPAAHALVYAIDEDGVEVAEAAADASGHVDLPVPAGRTYRICQRRAGSSAWRCSASELSVGLEPVHFGEVEVEFPTDAGEQAVRGRVLRSDDSPCYEAQTDAAFALQGGVTLSPTGSPPGGERTALSSLGTFVVAVPLSVPHTLHADCGIDTQSVDLGPAPLPSSVNVQMTNPLPSAATVDMVDDQGTPITDPSQVQPGDVITLNGSVTDADAIEYRWEITRGDGRFLGGTGDDRHASGQSVQWEVGGSSGVHQVTMWGSDGKGGIESVVAPVGPIIGNLTPGPCLAPPKLQKLLCATGYTASVPEPQAGLSEFLVYKYRNSSRNSAGDACLYYNLVDPDCIDMNCDGIVDPGTDPMGKCKRTTLGGWWQKNGFDTNGLGTDVVSAWYLNANDLGFGREMHCRVTSWSSIIAERPAGAPTSAERFVSSLRDEIQSSPQALEYAKLFNLYPSTVACYVTNYTTDHCFNYPTNDPHNANLAYQGQLDFVANPTVNPTNAYGTVAMEFGPVEGFGDLGAITKFFVYNGRTASGKRLTSANLDGCGPKSVPELCMNCHGGSWPGQYSQGTQLDAIVAGLSGLGGVLAGIDANDTVSTDAGYLLRKSILDEITHEEYGFSSFLPFDPDTFVFPAAAPQASQAASLRSLNQLVLYTKPVTPIRDLVKGWYGNNLVSGTFAPWRPTAWNDDGSNPGDESDLHDEVYAKACRVCHAAHYSFPSALSFPMSSRICKNGSGYAGGFKTMPHAKLTYLNLWKGDYPQALTMPTIEAWFTASEGGFVSCD